MCSYPDVMMPAYQSNPWSSIFFIVYISLQIFLFMKLVIIVLYINFCDREHISISQSSVATRL